MALPETSSVATGSTTPLPVGGPLDDAQIARLVAEVYDSAPVEERGHLLEQLLLPLGALSLVAIEASGAEVFNGLVAPLNDPGITPSGSVSFVVKPGRLRLRLAIEGDGDVPPDNEDREVIVPDVTSPDLRIATPRVFVARSGLEFQQLRKNPAPVPTALREFRRTDRLIVRDLRQRRGLPAVDP